MDADGPSQCAVPDQGSLYLDRRLTWGETADSALAEVRSAMGADAESVRVGLKARGPLRAQLWPGTLQDAPGITNDELAQARLRHALPRRTRRGDDRHGG